jgi:uroporphyrinogen decarboxylase
MTETLFMRAVRGEPLAVPPIWLMRQAGRYHRPYQHLRARHSFESLCREPELAAEVTMGPILDFDFDAAILFSDLLFPLEALGMGLKYDPGPKLDGALDDARLARFRPIDEALSRLRFQHDAMVAVRARLPREKGLIGFVGGPWTLFVYAVEGTHAGPLARAKASPALYRAFTDRMVPLLIENIRLQFEGGADVVMIFDTAAGELSPEMFTEWTLSDLTKMASAFPGRLGYYRKSGAANRPRVSISASEPPSTTVFGGKSTPEVDLFAGVGLDSHWDLAAALTAPGRHGFIQGNFDETALASPDRATFTTALTRFLEPMRHLDAEARRGWICGLGHGVLPGTPEDHVRAFVDTVRKTFS